MIRFSLNSILLLTIGAAATWYALNLNVAIKETEAVGHFVGPKVKGKVKEYRPRTIAKITPEFFQSWIGEEYFRTPEAVYVYIYLDPADRQMYHRKQSPELAIRCVSNFTDIRYLDLGFNGSENPGPIDLSPLERCQHIHQLELTRANTDVVKDICRHVRFKSLSLNGCEVDDEMIAAISTSSNIESIQLNFSIVTGSMLQSLSEMENLKRLHFFQSLPVENKDGTFDFQMTPMSGGFPEPKSEKEIELNKQATKWLSDQLPGVSISGLN